MFTNRLLSRPLIVLISGCILLYVASPVFLALAAPLAQNPYNECPPNSNNIWVQLDDNNFGGQVATLSIPFDTGQVTINNNVYVNYLLGVLISEVGPTIDFDPVDDEALKAMAIAARTVALKNCGAFEFNGHRGIDDIDKQVYDPRNRETWLNSPTLGQAELDRYQQAIDETAGLYLTYNGSVFDAQYRDKSDDTTDDYDEAGNGTIEPHKGIYDPAGKFHATPVYSTPGLMQVNSNHWATGENHNETLLQWDYRGILAHYYTGIHIQNLSGSVTTPDYRWNPLAVDWGNGQPEPPDMEVGTTYNVNIQLQNTGAVNWGSDVRLSCRLKKPDGSIVNCETEANPGTLTMGAPAPTVTLPVRINSGSPNGVYTLMIDMKQGSSFFHNREAGKEWPTLNYKVCAGNNCSEIFLPLVLKDSARVYFFDTFNPVNSGWVFYTDDDSSTLEQHVHVDTNNGYDDNRSLFVTEQLSGRSSRNSGARITLNVPAGISPLWLSFWYRRTDPVYGGYKILVDGQVVISHAGSSSDWQLETKAISGYAADGQVTLDFRVPSQFGYRHALLFDRIMLSTFEPEP